MSFPKRSSRSGAFELTPQEIAAAKRGDDYAEYLGKRAAERNPGGLPFKYRVSHRRWAQRFAEERAKALLRVGSQMERALVCAFEGDPPELTDDDWPALLIERNRLGRWLTDEEARAVIRERQSRS